MNWSMTVSSGKKPVKLYITLRTEKGRIRALFYFMQKDYVLFVRNRLVY